MRRAAIAAVLLLLAAVELGAIRDVGRGSQATPDIRFFVGAQEPP